MGSMFHRRKHVALITDAQRSPVEDWHRRRREYAVLQGSRIPFLLLAALAYMLLHNLVLAAIFYCDLCPSSMDRGRDS